MAPFLTPAAVLLTLLSAVSPASLPATVVTLPRIVADAEAPVLHRTPANRSDAGSWHPTTTAEPTGHGVWPLDPRPDVVRGFDPPSVRWGSGHRGVDLRGRSEQPVRAALAGTISFAGRLAGRGVVVVDHGTTRTTYEPVSAEVRRGDHVAGGQRLGRLEAAMSHCAPHSCLHWGLIRGKEYLDPLTLVGLGPVRLLPWR